MVGKRLKIDLLAKHNMSLAGYFNFNNMYKPITG